MGLSGKKKLWVDSYGSRYILVTGDFLGRAKVINTAGELVLWEGAEKKMFDSWERASTWARDNGYEVGER